MAKVLDRKLKKVVELRSDSSTMIQCLDSLGSFYDFKSTAEARKSLRSDIDGRNVATTEEFCNHLHTVMRKIQTMEDGVSELEADCKSISQKLDEADSEMKQFTRKMRQLREKTASLEKQSNEVEYFMKQYQLSDEEIEVLEKGLVEGGEMQFFEVMARLKLVKDRCKTLMTTRHQTVGFDLIESLSKSYEKASNHLYDYVQERCESLRDEEVEADKVLQMAVRALKEMPSYYIHSQDIILKARSRFLVRRFILALTQGDAKGGFPPIEIHAHDPVKYLGDMLAWLYQAIMTEEELMRSLFDCCEVDKAVKESVVADDEALEEDPTRESLKSLDECMTIVTEGVVKPLKVHKRCVMYISKPEEDKDCCLLAKLGESHELARLLADYRKETNEKFEKLLRVQGAKLVNSRPTYPSDLSTLPATTSHLKKLGDIIQTRTQTSEDDQIDLETVLSLSLEPLLQMCRLSAETLDTSDTAILMLNNSTSILSFLQRSRVDTVWIENLTSEIGTWMDVLVKEEAEAMLNRSGLSSILQTLQLSHGDAPKSSLPGLDETTIKSCMESFYSSLFSLILPDFDKLKDQKIKEQARRSASTIILEAHNKVYNMVINESNRYQDTSFLIHTPDQVRVLLDLDS